MCRTDNAEGEEEEEEEEGCERDGPFRCCCCPSGGDDGMWNDPSQLPEHRSHNSSVTCPPPLTRLITDPSGQRTTVWWMIWFGEQG